MYGTCVIMGQSNDYKLYVVTWSLIMHVCKASSNNFKGRQAGRHACMHDAWHAFHMPLPARRPIRVHHHHSAWATTVHGIHAGTQQSDRRPKRTHGLKCARAHTHSRLKKKKKKKFTRIISKKNNLLQLSFSLVKSASFIVYVYIHTGTLHMTGYVLLMPTFIYMHIFTCIK